MSRILFLVFLAVAVWLVVRLLGGSREPRPGAQSSAEPDAATREVETIRQCAWCGVHVPAGAALPLPDGRIYCGEEHRDAARRVAGPGA
jgi:hypothetical protein